MRGMATIFLVLPSFGGASYIYTYFFKQYCTEDTCESSCSILGQRSTSFKVDENSKLLDISDSIAVKSKLQEKKPVLYQVYSLAC